jgi:uncharacterized protein (TIGR03083 family)
MDYGGHFSREVAAFEAAGRTAAGCGAAPVVPSCPGWVITDLILHLGMVHRSVSRVIGERLQQPPPPDDRSWLGLAEQWRGWLPPARAPHLSAVPAGLLDWFHDGAADLRERFGTVGPHERVWTWSADHSVGFWARMQAVEAAVHRWDAENAVGTARPVDAALAADAVGLTFEALAPMRRAVGKAPPGHGERFFFRRTDGPGSWAVQIDGDCVVLGAPDGQYDIQVSGTASDLALFLWQRAAAGELDIHGDMSLLSRYFVLVPPL